MTRKKIIVFYNVSTPEQAKIADTDFKKFFQDLVEDFKKEGISLGFSHCRSSAILNSKIKEYLDESFEELYLHFSGHGSTKGISYNDWLLSNKDFSIMVDHPKIKGCFFSSCKASQLVQLVAKRSIPIVIGTKENDVTNSYAIEFQKKFYRYLLKKRTFKDAFEQSIKDLNQKENQSIPIEPIMRGEGAFDDIDEEQINDLQIIIQEEDIDKALLYPTVIDKMVSLYPNRELEDQDINQKALLLVYSDSSQDIDFFNDLFYHKNNRFDTFLNLIFLRENDLVELKNIPDEIKTLVDIKFLILFSGQSQYVSGLSFFNTFRDKNDAFFNSSNIHVRFAFLNLGTDNITSLLAVNTKIYQNLNKKQTRFDEESVQVLFQNNEFRDFLLDMPVSYENRTSYTYAFPCIPSKKEVRNLDTANISFQVFYINSYRERVGDFLINYLKHYLEISNVPNIIVNQHRRPEAIARVLENEIAIHFSNKKGNLSAKLVRLLQDSSCVIKINLDEQSDLSEVNEIIKEFENAFKNYKQFNSITGEELRWNSIFAFVYFSETQYKSLPFTSNLTEIGILPISPPKDITSSSIEDWIDIVENSNKKKHIELGKKAADKIIIDQLESRCPSFAIEKICDEFKIPRCQILHV